MKVLLDACVWGGARSHLVKLGHDVVWVGDWNQDPGDDDVLAFAAREGRVLVTLDKDFGELAVVRGQEHAGIVRLIDFAAREQGPACAKVLAIHGDTLAAGALIVAGPGRMRVRPRTEP